MSLNKRPLTPVDHIEPSSAYKRECSHCPNGDFDMARTIMKPHVFERGREEVKKHIPSLRVCSLYKIGEPLLNTHFMTIISRVKDLSFPLVKAVSNGMLIKPEMCDNNITSGVNEFELSMDGQSPEENDRIWINSQHERLNAILYKLVEANGNWRPNKTAFFN